MSLLLDALDRAERARREQRSLAHPELSLEPVPGEQGSAGGPDATTARAQAASLFQLDDNLPGPWRRRMRRWLPVVLLLLLVAAGAGAWLWSSLQLPSTAVNTHPPLPPPANPAPAAAGGMATATTAPAAPAALPVAAPPAAPSAAPSAAAAAAPAPAAAPVAAAAAAGAAVPAASTPPAPSVAAVTDAIAGAAASARGVPAPGAAPRRAGVVPVRRPAGTSGKSAPAGAGDRPQAEDAGAAAGAGVPASPPVDAPSVDVRLFRSSVPAQTDPALLGAWAALRDGRLDEAAGAYQRLEKQQPRSVDVQLGLGRLAAEQGRPEEARQRYRRALELDPRNATALASLAVLEPAGSGGELDSQLRSRAAGSEGDARFALAARQSAAGQWPEAEQAWFDALREHPGDPDVLFNLAVSLDHLGQAAAARQYYGEALRAAQARPAHFNRMQVDQRLQALGTP